MANNTNYKSAQKHREWVTLTLTRMISDLNHIREKTDAQERHLSKQNDRIRKTENSISTLKGIGSVVAVVFTAIFGFFFNKN
jgi:hypothetical protein